MGDEVRWGVLGTARIAVAKVIPAMQRGTRSEVVAIASRSPDRARQAASALGVPKAHGSYEALLGDPDVEAVYVPLPNHLHVPWSTRAAEHGKHVLCEKPIGLSAAEAAELLATRDRTGVRIGEAFIVRAHPQWETVVEFVRSGRIGDLRSVEGHFSFVLQDEGNVRNVRAFGGGALLDLGCYLVHVSRLVFGREPVRAVSAMERDPRSGVDMLTSLTLDFGGGLGVGVCGMRSVRHQHVRIMGTSGRIDLETPFAVPPDHPCHFTVVNRAGPTGERVERVTFQPCNQFTVQGDAFSRAIREGGPVPCPLEDSVANMRALDALSRSAGTKTWEPVSDAPGPRG